MKKICRNSFRSFRPTYISVFSFSLFFFFSFFLRFDNQLQTRETVISQYKRAKRKEHRPGKSPHITQEKLST